MAPAQTVSLVPAGRARNTRVAENRTVSGKPLGENASKMEERYAIKSK